MPTPTIITRATKGSALTYNELDTNFTNLRDASGQGATFTSNSTTVNVTTAGTYTITFTNQIVFVYVTATSGFIYLDITDAKNYPLQPLLLIINKVNTGAYQTGPEVGFTASFTGSPFPGGGVGVSAGNQMGEHESGFAFFDIMYNVNLYTSGIYASSPQPIMWSRRRDGPPGYPFAGATFAQGFRTDGSFTSIAHPTIPTLDRSIVTFSYSNNSTVDFASFSGMIIVNRQDGGSGNVALWLVGGNSATKLGDSVSNTSGTIAYVSAISGYRWTNNTGGTVTASFASVKTREGS